MTGIVFEAYAPTGTSGALSARLPPLRSRISSAATPALIGQLPALQAQFSGTQTIFGSINAKLPSLRSRLAAKGGASLIGQLPPLRSYISGSPTPSASSLIATLPPLRAQFSGYQTLFGTLNAKLPSLRSRMRSTSGAALVAQLPPLRAQLYSNRGNSVTCFQSAGYVYGAGASVIGQALQERLTLGDASLAQAIYLLKESLALRDTPTGVLDALAVLGERLSFSDIIAIAYQVLVSETLQMQGTPTGWAKVAMALADTLSVAAGPGSTLNAQVAVATALTLADTLARVWRDTLTEDLALSDATSTTLRATLQLLDALRVQDQPSNTVTFLMQSAETLALTDAASSTAVFQNVLSEGLGLLAQITIGDASYLAWVVNTENRAFVKYRNFPFNSFAKVGSRYFGAAMDGIYLLEGDDDAGTPINALLRGGLSDLGTSLLKRQHSVYVGLTTAGQMLLKVTAITPSGGREEHWYAMSPRGEQALTENRVPIGKGLKSTYWGWELANVDGADFALDTIAWYPMILERRL